MEPVFLRTDRASKGKSCSVVQVVQAARYRIEITWKSREQLFRLLVPALSGLQKLFHQKLYKLKLFKLNG